MRTGGVNNMKKYKIAVAGTGYVGLIPFRKGIERTARWIKEDEGM